jgi:hypothetical protein
MTSSRRLLSAVCALTVTLCAAPLASAQTIFKHVEPGGRIVYTDRVNAPTSARAVGGDANGPLRPAVISPVLTVERAALIDANEARRAARATSRQVRGVWPGAIDVDTVQRLAPSRLALAGTVARPRAAPN